MTFNTYETSNTGGAPVELYEFRRGVAAWYYTSADISYTHNGNAYSPTPILRGEIERGNELSRRELTITLPGDSDIAEQFRVYPPGEVATLTIYQRHRSDPDAEVRTIWIGRILNALWRDEGTVVDISCEPFLTGIRRNGLTRKYDRGCPHTLYEEGFGKCNVIRANFRVQGTLSLVNGNVIEVSSASGHADGYFVGGYVYWQLPDGRRDARMILGHTGTSLTLAAQLPLASIGDAVELYPGCDRTMSQCDSRFSNIDNFGGWPFIPGKNPFNGTMIY